MWNDSILQHLFINVGYFWTMTSLHWRFYRAEGNYSDGDAVCKIEEAKKSEIFIQFIHCIFTFMAFLWNLACPILHSGLQKNGGVQKYFFMFPTAYSEIWFSLLFSVGILVLCNIEILRNLYANKPRGHLSISTRWKAVILLSLFLKTITLCSIFIYFVLPYLMGISHLKIFYSNG